MSKNKRRKKQRKKPQTRKAKPSLSLVMIAKNEEQDLPRALDSAQAHVDEIILVDTGSTDRTIQIAESYGAKVYHHPWQNDFSLHRNQALSYAACDWVLQLDADEALDQSSAAELPSLLAEKRFNGYMVEIQNLFTSGEKTVFQWPRLFRNHINANYFRKVHNQVEIPGKIGQSGLVIYHYGYSGDEKTLKAKQARRVPMMRAWVQESPTDYEARYYLAQTLVAQPETVKEAIEQAAKGLDLAYSQKIDKQALSRLYLPLLQGLSQLEDHEKVAQKGIEWAQMEPNHPDPHLFLARAFLGLKQWEKVDVAARNFFVLHKKLAEHPESLGAQEVNSHGLKYVVSACWCAALARLGQNEQALNLYSHLIPDNAQATARMTAELTMEKGSVQIAFEMAQMAIKEHPNWDWPQQFMQAPSPVQKPAEPDPRQICDQAFEHASAGDTYRAMSLYEKALSLDPNLTGATFNLAVIHLQNGEVNRAGRLLQDCLAKEPSMTPARELLKRIQEAQAPAF
jgi:tetratricopeptide (TPR) repeat protein